MSRPGRWSLRTTSPEGVVIGALDEAPARARGGGTWRWIALIVAALAALATVTAAVVSHVRSSEAPWSPAQPRIDLRRSADLPAADLGWVRMRDHFTVTIGGAAGQGAPLGDLLVVADTTIQPWASFPQHRHAGIEVVNLVLDGTLTHDEGGRALELGPGAVQVIAAGAGVVHAEANRSGAPVRVLQLWFASPTPDRPPAQQVVTPAGDGPVALSLLRQDVQLARVALEPGATSSLTIPRGRVAYVVCVGGAVELDSAHLDDGDGATLIDGHFAVTAAGGPARLLVIELPAPPDMILR